MGKKTKNILVMHLGWESRCELGDVEACHISRPGALRVPLNTAWSKS